MTLNFKDFDATAIRDVYAPIFQISEDCAVISSKNSSGYSAGTLEYTQILNDTLLNSHCKISIPYQKEGKTTTVAALIFFFDQYDKKIQGDYLHNDGENLYTLSPIPEGAVRFTLSLMFSCKGVGNAKFFSGSVELTHAPSHRIAHVATAFIDGKGNEEDNLEQVLALIDEAGKSGDKPDVICFAEGVYDLRCKRKIYLSDDSPQVMAVCERAKKNDIYVLFTTHEKDSRDYYYNSAFLISNTGEICGRYRKCQLTQGEYLAGIVPGDDFPVFDTPFGKIGILICWDQWFGEASHTLVAKGAEIIFWLTRGFHEERVITRARDNGVYYVTAHSRPQNCCIVHSTTGNIIVRGGGSSGGFVSAKIDLDERPVSEYKSFGKNGANDKEIFLNERRTDLYFR